MKLKIILSNTLIFIYLFSFSSCAIAGEEVCGIWMADGDYGKMKIEITPWKGKFHGYLLEYKNGNEFVKGAKEDEFIFLTDLIFENDNYQNGKIYLDTNSEEHCGITLHLQNKNRLEAIYDCKDESYKETWVREGHEGIVLKKKDAKETIETEVKDSEVSTISKTTTTPTVVKNKAIVAPVKKETIKEKEEVVIEEETKKQTSFFVAGFQKQVDYDDDSKINIVLENLWKDAVSDDLYNALPNKTDSENMYVVYSNYDQPKGKMTITIGYKVKDLSSVSGLISGAKVPSNDYLVYELSGGKSDYEGEGWKEIEELMSYRKAESADFEIYSFDANYEVTKAYIWIATK